jgi:hypothetical protein
MYRLTEDVINQLIEEARRYDAEELNLYQAELGWQDWMNDFTEADDGEEFTEAEGKVIDEITEQIFRLAHNTNN